MIFRGIDYNNAVELAIDYNMNLKSYFDALSQGYSFEEAVKNSEMITYNEIDFDTYSELADFFFLSRKFVIYSILNGFKIEDIINTRNGALKKGVIYQGVYYSDLDDLVKNYTVKKKK